MLTSTYFAFFFFFNECPGLNERPFWKVENWMSSPALIQIITVVDILHFFYYLSSIQTV